MSAPPSPSGATPSSESSICASSALALLVARDGQIPLYAEPSQGHTVDATRFLRLPHRHPAPGGAAWSGQFEDLTLVDDKGNNSKSNQALVDPAPGALCRLPRTQPTRRPQRDSRGSLHPLGPGPLAKLPV